MNSVKVPAIQRAERVIDYVASCVEPPNAGEIGTSLGMAKSSLHALLQTLTELGWLTRNSANRYRLGHKLLEWAQAVPLQRDIVVCFNEVMENVQALEQYTLTLTMLKGDEVVYLACRESFAPLGFTFRLGMSLPAIYTATGKAMLATFDSATLEVFLRQHPWPEPLTIHGVADHAALHKELDMVRSSGYSIDNGQVRAGMFCVGVAVSTAGAGSNYGIAVSMLEHEASKDELQRCGEALQRIAAQLNRSLMGN